MTPRSRRPKVAGAQPAGTPLSPIVERIGPPISRVPWAPNVVGQSLEILAVSLDRGVLSWFKPVHSGSLRVGLPRGAEPSERVLEVIGWYPLRPRVVHSTSWRYEEDQLVLTYLVVVEAAGPLPPASLEILDVERTALDRGGSMAPPDSIALAAVLEHALRHLSWLIRDDPAIAKALPDWSGLLDGYLPEPFRALG